MNSKKIVLLCTDDDFSRIVYNTINEKYEINHVIIEGKESKKLFLKRRIRRLGIFKVFGQLIFQIVVSKILLFISRSRIVSLKKLNNLNTNSFPAEKITHVASINNTEAIEKLIEYKPDLILVNGTRILSKKLLNTTSCKLLNIHAGITPKYRGVHGAYWALVNNDIVNAGVTVHLVDAGIDTGNILAQDIISISSKDNFVTYPYLQISKGVLLLQNIIAKVLNNNIVFIDNKLQSKLYYHPTVFEYFYYRVFKGIK